MNGIIILPVYNKADVLIEVLMNLEKVLQQVSHHLVFLIVDDGSNDNFGSLELNKPNYRVLRMVQNGGKGAAIKAGIENSHAADFAILFDADLDIDPSCLPDMIHSVVNDTCDIAISSKLHVKSTVDYTKFRRTLSLGYFYLIKFLFRLSVKDTQTGAKVFGAKAFTCLTKNEQQGFVFDLEALLRAKRLGLRVKEFPVTIRMAENSTVTIREILKMLFATIKLRIEHHNE